MIGDPTRTAPTTHEERLALLVELAMEAHDAVAAAVGMGGGPPLYRERTRVELEQRMSIAAEHWKIDLTQVPNVEAERVRADDAEQCAEALRSAKSWEADALVRAQNEGAQRERSEAAEAQLAALRVAAEAMADAIARERLTADGDLADVAGPGALERLGAAEAAGRDALANTWPTAEAYTRRLRAEVCRWLADSWKYDHQDSPDAEAVADWLRAEAERVEGGGT